MKINIDPRKSADMIADFGKTAAENVQEGAKFLADKASDGAYLWRQKKYSPLFPDVYQSESFHIPNMIVIEDDAVRKGIDVCEGAIGWLSKDTGMEVLHLYDEAVAMSGLEFVPSAKCDEIYYVDPFNRSRFIRVDTIFDKAHKDKLAELGQVACSLGAKRCTIELVESVEEEQQAKKKAGLREAIRLKGHVVSDDKSAEQELRRRETTQRSGRDEMTFQGSDQPSRPTLKWFAHDDTIKGLIDMRCSGINSIQKKTMELTGASSATMSQKTACAIDNAVGKLGVKGHVSMEAQVTKEIRSKLIYTVEF